MENTGKFNTDGLTNNLEEDVANNFPIVGATILQQSTVNNVKEIRNNYILYSPITDPSLTYELIRDADSVAIF